MLREHLKLQKVCRCILFVDERGKYKDVRHTPKRASKFDQNKNFLLHSKLLSIVCSFVLFRKVWNGFQKRWPRAEKNKTKYQTKNCAIFLCVCLTIEYLLALMICFYQWSQTQQIIEKYSYVRNIIVMWKKIEFLFHYWNAENWIMLSIYDGFCEWCISVSVLYY